MNKNIFLLFLTVLLLAPNFSLAQQTKQTPKETTTSSNSTNSTNSTTSTTSTQSLSAPKTKKIAKRKPIAVKEEVIEIPSLADRLNQQRLALRRGEEREQSQPYLIEEVTVNGVYKSVEGYGAFLKAINGRLFFAYRGMLFYDGEILQIDPDQVIFQQNLPKGKTKQIIKAYDPSALRSSTIDKDKETKKKKTQKDDEESEDAGTKDE
ncbi:MAG: hypothetical protein HY819_22290 [Acidobacteria bacterium]|nr:hypothetical protein [Acidobacteriota bacterium]